MIWQKLGSVLAILLISTLISVSSTLLFFRKYITPGINEALDTAETTIKKIAALGGIKKADYESVSEVEQLVGRGLIERQMPELAGLQLLLPDQTWDKVESLLDENPEAALHLYQKYKHLLGGSEQAEKETDF